MPCPYCREPLGLTLEFITKNPVSKCPHCDTVFNFAVSDEIIKKFRKVTSEIEDIKKQYKGIVKFK